MILPAGLAMAAPLAPWLWWQGRQVRRNTPLLPEAEGPRSGSLTQTGIAREAPGADPGSTTRLRLLLLGDSSAAGVGARDQREALSGQLMTHLQPRLGTELPENLHWTLRARTGVRTREALTLLEGLEDACFDQAVIALGVNDVTALASPSRWIGDVATLVEHLRNRFGVQQVLWSALPPMHRFTALPQPLRAVMGRHARDLDAALGQHAARHPSRLRHVPMPPMDPAVGLASDGFHPGPAAYSAWARVLAEAISACELTRLPQQAP